MRYILFVLTILFSLGLSGQENTTRTEEDAKNLIDSLYLKLKSGANFKIIADKYSEDPATNKNGGKYETVKVGTITGEFEDVVLKLKVSQISKPFKTSFGYHIAQLLKRQGDTYSVRHILITYKS